jgi:hypothetical protein
MPLNAFLPPKTPAQDCKDPEPPATLDDSVLAKGDLIGGAAGDPGSVVPAKREHGSIGMSG